MESISKPQLFHQRVILDDVEGHHAVRSIDFVELLFLRVVDVVVKQGVGGGAQHGLSHGFIVPCADEVRNARFCGICFACSLARYKCYCCHQGDTDDIKYLLHNENDDLLFYLFMFLLSGTLLRCRQELLLCIL